MYKQGASTLWTEKRFYILVFFFFLLVFLTTMGGYFDIPDTMPSLKTAESLIDSGKLEVEVKEQEEIKLIGDDKPRQIAFTYFKTKNGKIYSKYGLGLPICMIPFVLFGRLLYLLFGSVLGASREFLVNFSVSSMNSFSTALACLFIIKFARRMKFSFTNSFILSVLFGLGTMAWFYANSTFSEALFTLELLGSIYFAFKASETKRNLDIAISALFAGAMILTKIASAILLLVLVAYVAYIGIKQKNKSTIITFLSLIIAFVALLLWLNFIRFGNILETGYGQEIGRVLGKQSLFSRFWPFLFSPEYGFFIYSPVLFLFFFSLGQYYKKQKPLFFLTFGMSLLYIAAFLTTSYSPFTSWGPRYFLILIPYFVLPIGYLLEKKKKIIYIATVFLFIVSFAINLAGVLVSHGEYRYVKKGLLRMQAVKNRHLVKVVPPSDIEGVFILLKKKVLGEREIYTSGDFGVKNPYPVDVIIRSYKYDKYRGFDLWYMYLERKTGYGKAKVFPLLTLPLILVLAVITLVLAKRLDIS